MLKLFHVESDYKDTSGNNFKEISIRVEYSFFLEMKMIIQKHDQSVKTSNYYSTL